jgi:hypothetical protein
MKTASQRTANGRGAVEYFKIFAAKMFERVLSALSLKKITRTGKTILV